MSYHIKKRSETIMSPENYAQVDHIFFHSLINYPELAWSSSNSMAEGYRDWMLTTAEFTALLQELYHENYVLVRQRDCFKTHPDGSMSLAVPALAPGKKPLIMSFDDVNYYTYMQNSGFAKKLVINQDQELAAEVLTPSGSPIITTAGDCLPILEQFIKKHPDFSYQNARGLIAVTGFEGILGYRIAPDNDRSNTLEAETAALTKVVDWLKQKGWEFACHSYTHNSGWFKTAEPPLEKIIYDTNKWKRIIEPLIGKTDTYIAPFGSFFGPDNPCHRYIIEADFKYYCIVNKSKKITFYKNHLIISRFNIDGFTFRNNQYAFEANYGDLSKIIDNKRTPAYKPYARNRKNFLAHADFFLNAPTIYVWGGLGLELTTECLLDLAAEYPEYYTPEKQAAYAPYLDKNYLGCDCSGLIKNFLMGGVRHFVRDNTYDYNSRGLLDNAAVKGDISSLPELGGLCLYMQGHVGIYIGNGEVIESTNNPLFGNGVVKTRLSARPWEKWFQCPHVSYED